MNISTYGSNVNKCKVTKGKHINFKIQLREIGKAANLPQLFDLLFHNLNAGCCLRASPQCRCINQSGPRRSDSGSRRAFLRLQTATTVLSHQAVLTLTSILCSHSPTAKSFFFNMKKYRSFLITKKTLYLNKMSPVPTSTERIRFAL